MLDLLVGPSLKTKGVVAGRRKPLFLRGALINIYSTIFGRSGQNTIPTGANTWRILPITTHCFSRELENHTTDMPSTIIGTSSLLLPNTSCYWKQIFAVWHGNTSKTPWQGYASSSLTPGIPINISSISQPQFLHNTFPYCIDLWIFKRMRIA